MRTVGDILKTTRLQKKLSLDEVEEATKIRKKFLVAIESDNYTDLPSISYAKGFVKNYSDYLGLNSSNVQAFFRRQTKEASRSSILPKGLAEPLNRSFIQMTPSKFIILTVMVLVGLFVLYFGLQYKRLQEPPYLLIESPKDKIVVTDKRIDVYGKTDSDATITINGVGIIVRSDGKFFDQVNIEPGINKVTIVATSRFGKSNQKIRQITRK